VDPGASLAVVGSTITVYKKVTAGSYAVYAQNGADSVTLSANTINMIEEESTGYTHLIGTEGAYIGTITLSGNTSDAEVALLLADGTENDAKEYAIAQNAVAVDEQLRILSVATDISGIFTRTDVDPFWENYTLPPVIIGGGGGGGGGVDPAAEAAAKAAAEAAAKAAAEAAAKAAAEAAAKAAAEAAAKAAAEAAAKAAVEAAAKSTIKYRITSKTKSIFIDLADTYAYQVADVSARLLVLRNGKKVYRYVAIDSVALDSQGKATSKTKALLKIGTVIRVMIDGSVVKSVKIT
jgi:pyruvate/2-oxoglutarate dehydrogenase complex dihydrolipoamide acyltransferase (E2) component